MIFYNYIIIDSFDLVVGYHSNSAIIYFKLDRMRKKINFENAMALSKPIFIILNFL